MHINESTRVRAAKQVPAQEPQLRLGLLCFWGMASMWALVSKLQDQ